MNGRIISDGGRWIVIGDDGKDYPLSGEDCLAIFEYGYSDPILGSPVRFKIEKGEAVIQITKP